MRVPDENVHAVAIDFFEHDRWLDATVFDGGEFSDFGSNSDDRVEIDESTVVHDRIRGH